MCSQASPISHARPARARRRVIVAVTGSVGKTGTKEALRLALGADGETHASAASYNNHWGVPLSLARMPETRALRRVRARHEPRRRDHAADANGSSACRDHHHDRAGASRIFRIAREDCRRQGGNLCWPGAGRRRGTQPRQRAIRSPDARCRKPRVSRASCRSANTPTPTRGCSRSRCSRTARPCARRSWEPRSPTSSARRAATSCSIRSPC